MDKSTRHWYDRFDAVDPTIEAPVRKSPGGKSDFEEASTANVRSFGLPAMAAVAATAALAAALVFLGLPAGQQVRQVFVAPFEDNFTAPPYFSLAAFRELKPGMEEDEVRDRVGYPWVRRGNRAQGVYWIFTAPVPGEPVYRRCTAIFDPRRGCLRLTRETEAAADRNSVAFGALETGPVRSIRFGAAGAGQEIVRSTDPPCPILTGVKTAREAGRSVASVSDWIRTLGLRPCAVRYVYMGPDAEGFARAAETLAGEGLFVRSQPSFPAEEAGLIYLYAHGRIITLPPYRDPEHGSERLADQEWVLRRYLQPAVPPNT